MDSRKFKTLSGLTAFIEDQHRRGHRVWHVLVLHDDVCTPSQCRCKPDYVAEPATADNLQAGAQAEAEWRKSVSS